MKSEKEILEKQADLQNEYMQMKDEVEKDDLRENFAKRKVLAWILHDEEDE